MSKKSIENKKQELIALQKEESLIDEKINDNQKEQEAIRKKIEELQAQV